MELPKLQKIESTEQTPKIKKKKILFLGDDLRLASGIATVSREIVLGTINQFDWVQLAGAIKNKDQGKIIDVSEATRKETGVQDASVKLYPVDGYGNPDLVRELIHLERPDAILHITDPRFWGYLYSLEHEIRQIMPILYYNVWDNAPLPLWNKSAYQSCDLLMCISKQTEQLVKMVLGKENCNILGKSTVTYIPHGINEKTYYPIKEDDKEFIAFKEKMLRNLYGKLDFMVFYNSRNIRRKLPGDTVLAFKTFCDQLPKEKAERCALLMHTQTQDPNGTDLLRVSKEICPEYKVLFSTDRSSQKELNYMYNMSDVTINISSNEGFGLSIAESLMAGTPIIANVTGGLQDQMRFGDENGKWISFNEDFVSNHNGRYKKCGDWAIPIFPKSRSLQGSIPTPYIFDDRCHFEDVSDAIMKYYQMSKEERERRGSLGRQWVMSDESMMSARKMCENVVKDINQCLTEWKPRERFSLYKLEKEELPQKMGILLNQ